MVADERETGGHGERQREGRAWDGDDEHGRVGVPLHQKETTAVTNHKPLLTVHIYRVTRGCG